MAVAVYGDIEVPGQKDDIGLAYKSKGDVRVTNSFNWNNVPNDTTGLFFIYKKGEAI